MSLLSVFDFRNYGNVPESFLCLVCCMTSTLTTLCASISNQKPLSWWMKQNACRTLTCSHTCSYSRWWRGKAMKRKSGSTLKLANWLGKVKLVEDVLIWKYFLLVMETGTDTCMHYFCMAEYRFCLTWIFFQVVVSTLFSRSPKVWCPEESRSEWVSREDEGSLWWGGGIKK